MHPVDQFIKTYRSEIREASRTGKGKHIKSLARKHGLPHREEKEFFTQKMAEIGYDAENLERDSRLTEIAKKSLFIDSLIDYNSYEDFREQSTSTIREALREAYEAGRQAK
ncbi:MAG: hypothetical protein AAF442_09470 [Pseudomonadota bacterium]